MLLSPFTSEVRSAKPISLLGDLQTQFAIRQQDLPMKRHRPSRKFTSALRQLNCYPDIPIGRTQCLIGMRARGYNNNNSDGQQGDIKTGLFRDSFLEDPWRELVPRKTGLRAGVENTPRTNVPRATHSGQGKPKERPYETTEKVDDEDAEGEIVLSDSDEDTDQVEGDTGIGLGDGLVEAARNIMN